MSLGGRQELHNNYSKLYSKGFINKNKTFQIITLKHINLMEDFYLNCNFFYEEDDI